jgi:hypothetical protein
MIRKSLPALDARQIPVFPSGQMCSVCPEFMLEQDGQEHVSTWLKHAPEM